MASAFSPDGSEPLGRQIEKCKVRPEAISVEDFFQLDKVTQFLIGYSGFVALQLADSMLSDAIEITSALENMCPGGHHMTCTLKTRFCIVADSTFGDGDVDEVGAMHLENHRIVHFGDSNCKQNTKIQTLFIRINPHETDAFTEPLKELLSKLGNEDVSILSENELVLDSIKNCEIPKTLLDLDKLSGDPTSRIIYIGSDQNPKLIAWVMQNQPEDVFVVSPVTGKVSHNPVNLGRLLMQRFHMIEKGKDAQRVALLVGSNGAHDLTLKCIEKLRALGQKVGKIVYTVVVGEPTPQKLGNFPEMDAFVLIGSPELSILPSKGFYKPVIHPWEFMMACSGNEWNGKFLVNWALFLDEQISINVKETDISLITGEIRCTKIQEESREDMSKEISLIGSREVARILDRSLGESKEFFGLSQEKDAAPSTIKTGSTGIAATYDYEK